MVQSYPKLGLGLMVGVTGSVGGKAGGEARADDGEGVAAHRQHLHNLLQFQELKI